MMFRTVDMVAAMVGRVVKTDGGAGITAKVT